MSLNDSSTSGQGLSRDDPLFWQLPPTIDCNIVRTVGIFLCLASLVGICLNSSLLFSLLRYKVLRTPPNVFIMFIAAMGLLASCGNLPLSGSSSVFCRWLYGRSGCQMEGLIAFPLRMCQLLLALHGQSQSMLHHHSTLRRQSSHCESINPCCSHADDPHVSLSLNHRSRNVSSLRPWPSSCLFSSL